MDIILVPGLWLDGSSWAAVVPVLEAAGHRAHPLTLPGMQAADADRSAITLRDHVDAVVAEIDAAPEQVLLVGHSAGSAIAYAALDARPDRVAHVVYVGGFPVGDGLSIADDFPAENGEVPLPDLSMFSEDDLAGLDEAARERFRSRAIPSPERVTRDPQQLSADERRYAVPATAICTEYSSADLRDWIAQGMPPVREFPKLRQVNYVDLSTGHWPQFSRPDDLARAILACISASDLDEQGRPEPPLAADEAATLLGFLDFQRATLAWKCAGLDAAGLSATTAASSMTLGGLLKHLAYVEDSWCSIQLFGRDPNPPWDTVNWKADRDWEWHTAADDSPDELLALWQSSVERSRALVGQALREGGLDRLAARTWPDGRAPNLRWILVHLIEEYARHNGHADLLREAVDGQTGE